MQVVPTQHATVSSKSRSDSVAPGTKPAGNVSTTTTRSSSLVVSLRKWITYVNGSPSERTSGHSLATARPGSLDTMISTRLPMACSSSSETMAASFVTSWPCGAAAFTVTMISAVRASPVGKIGVVNATPSTSFMSTSSATHFAPAGA